MDKDKLVKCTQCNWEGIEAQAEEGCCPNCTADIIKKREQMEIKVGDKYRIKHMFGSYPQGYLVHIVAIVDEHYAVYKYYGRYKQYWHYGVEHIEVFKIWIDRSIEGT